MEKTIWGGNRLVVIQVHKPLRAARGKLEDSTDAPIAAALVEVFHHPEAAIRDQRPNRVTSPPAEAWRLRKPRMSLLPVRSGLKGLSGPFRV